MKSGRLFFLLALLAVSAAAAPALESRPRELLLASVRYSDGLWDESAGLLRSPLPGEQDRHRTRESTWYALGLLLRNQPGDDARAGRILERVLAHQLAAPGQPWDGTFRRFQQESAPGPGAELWRDFDPNWRHFIGTTFALILTEFESRLPAGLPGRLEDSIRRAVEGELTQGRAEPYHTNIKLMHGFLWSWAGARLHRPEWVAGGEQWAEAVAAAFAVHETFEEYNSPTYYGVDFYGLALMRRHGATPRIRELGARLEAGLWRDVARFYHAGLKNMAGPYDRAYGMDMRRYVSLTGTWMGLVLPAELTPLPDPSGPMGHAHDFLCTPTYVALGAQVPPEVLEHFRAFKGERVLRRPITATRTATAWLAPQVMIGGELTDHALGVTPGKGQFHPATIHWHVPGGEVGWVRLYASPPADAEAAKETLTLTAPVAGDFTWRISVPGLAAPRFGRDRWTLPGLTLLIEGDAAEFTLSPGEGFIDATYRGATRLTFRTLVPPPELPPGHPGLPDYSAHILTPLPGPVPRLTGPRVFGVRPGHEVRHRFTATGDRPRRFTAVGLPAGVALDEATGQLTGRLPEAGEHRLTITASNAHGAVAREFRLVVGEEIALTPPLGWNSWYAMGDRLDQAGALAAARALVGTGLADHGWSYINIDDGWQGERTGPARALQPGPRFPDLKQLADEVHALGLKLGLYSSPWVTTYAGYPGGTADAAEGAWEFPAAGQRADRRVGPHGFEAADAAQLATWGVDLLKYDWHPIELPEAQRMAAALRASGRDILYSLANGANIYHRNSFPRTAHLWRTSNDIEDDWASLERIWAIHAPWAPWTGPGHWADPDLLVVGLMGLESDLRPTRLTPDEQYTHVALWSLWAAPLFISCPLDRLDAFTLNLLTNDEVLDINQDPLGRQAVLVAKDGPLEAWAKPLTDGGYAVGLFNRGETAARARIAWPQLGAEGAQRVRDAWRQQDLGVFTGEFSAEVKPHGVVLLTVRPEGK